MAMPGKSALDPRKVGVLTWDTPENIKPTQDHVLIRVLPEPETQAGIIIPQSARRENKTCLAEVVAVGVGAWHDGAFGSNFVPVELVPGDTVLVSHDPGWELGELRMLRVGAIIGVVED
jgi:co-chaperonin GroES (HSP10)